MAQVIKSADLVTLSAGDLQLDLAPAVGGGIAGFKWRGIDLLRPADPHDLATKNPLGLGSFPMVPFSGRIANGRFEFDGRIVNLLPMLADQDHALHGQGWQRMWTCTARSANKAQLCFDHPLGEWPWAYRAEQSFDLRESRLIQTLSLENHSDTPMPAGLGLHPYFPRTADMQLRAQVDGYFPNDIQMLPGARSPPPKAWDWAHGMTLSPPIDHQFTGWDGRAEIWWPSRGVHVAMTTVPPLDYLVVYAPPGQDYACIEPVSHANNGLNRSANGAQDGMKVLAPRQRMTICVTLEITSLNSGE